MNPIIWDWKMDPNASLMQLREFQWQADAEGNVSLGQVCRYVSLVESLDNWLSKGGFPPSAWDNQRKQDKQEESVS